ncbi:MAG TPA: hypothetical protein VMT16_14710 [Thermoanaerobaculia bacterium]|nr:hypothetical protein [Thermoanaerobaculia bacterium]
MTPAQPHCVATACKPLMSLALPLLLAAASWGASASTAGAATPPADDAPDPEAAPAGEAEPSGDDEPDPCRVERPGDEPWLDHMRREIFETVCNTARRFDGFFGNRRFDEEAQRTHGRVQLRVLWDELDELDVDGRLRVRVDLPNVDERVNAFFGRETEGDFLTGSSGELDFLPDFFRREGDQEWLLGLGYRPVGNARRRTDFDVGIDLDTPIEPFVRGRYRQFWMVGDRNVLRLQETLYWQNQRGVGTTTRVDLERPVGQRMLARWANRGTFDESTEGLSWESGVTLFKGFGPNQAVAWFVGLHGSTDAEAALAEYGTRLTYRRRMLREWFFGELIGGVTWPRDDLVADRQAAWHFGFGFEIQFSGEDLGAGLRQRP